MSEKRCEACGGAREAGARTVRNFGNYKGAPLCAGCYRQSGDLLDGAISDRRAEAAKPAVVCRDAHGRELKVGDVVVGTERTDTHVRVERIKNEYSFCGVEISGPREGERGRCYSKHYWRLLAPEAPEKAGFRVGDRVTYLSGDVFRIDRVHSNGHYDITCLDTGRQDFGQNLSGFKIVDSPPPVVDNPRLPNGNGLEHERHGSPGPGVLSEHGASVPNKRGDPGACPPGAPLRFPEYPEHPAYAIPAPRDTERPAAPVNEGYEAFEVAVSELLMPRLPRGFTWQTDVVGRRGSPSWLLRVNDATGREVYCEACWAPFTFGANEAFAVANVIASALMAREARRDR